MRTLVQKPNSARKHDSATQGHKSRNPWEHGAHQKANQVADQVMRLSEPGLQRHPGKNGAEGAPQTKPLVLQESLQPQVGETEVPASVNKVLRSGGQPLGAAERGFFESRFGHSFGQVRVHTSDQAEDSARAIHARAYTVGQNIVFGRGQYAPGSTEGKRLLAHELTHVLQQGASVASGQVGVIRRSPDRELEEQAEAKRLKDAKAGGVVTTFPFAETVLESVASSRLEAGETNARIALGAIEDMRTGLDRIAVENKIIPPELVKARKNEVHWVPPGFPGFIRRLEVLGHGSTGPKPENVGYTFAGASAHSGYGYRAKDLRELEKKGFDFSRYLVDGATVHLEGCLVGKGELGRKFLYQVGRLFFGLKNGYVITNTCLSSKSVAVQEIEPCDPVTFKWPEDFKDLLKADVPAVTGQKCDPLIAPPEGFGCFSSASGDFTLQMDDSSSTAE